MTPLLALCLAIALAVCGSISIAFVAFVVSVASDIRVARREREAAQRKRAVEDATGRKCE